MGKDECQMNALRSVRSREHHLYGRNDFHGDQGEDHVFFRSNGFQHVEDGAVSDISAYLS